MDGLLLTGVFGSGKSTLVAEIAEALERNSVAYGAIDLDWLMWFDVPGMDTAQATDVYLRNVAAVVEGHRSIGVEHVVLAGAVRDRDEVDARRRATGVALRVVRLTVPMADIEQRLASDPTTGRRDDLQRRRAVVVRLDRGGHRGPGGRQPRPAATCRRGDPRLARLAPDRFRSAQLSDQDRSNQRRMRSVPNSALSATSATTDLRACRAAPARSRT